MLWHCLLGGRKGIRPVKNGGWWRWALISPDGVAPSRMVSVSASVNLFLHHKVQKFSSGTGSPGWSQKRAVKLLCCGCGSRWTWIIQFLSVFFLHLFQKRTFGNVVQVFYRPDALRVTQPAVSKHWRKVKAVKPVRPHPFANCLLPLLQSWQQRE